MPARSGEGAKPSLDVLGADSREGAVKPLAVCYVLRPVSDEGGFCRRQLSDVHAAIAGVSFSKLAGLAGGRFAGEVLERSARLARTTPMYAVDIPRDLDQLGRVADSVMAWHRSPMPNVASVR